MRLGQRSGVAQALVVVILLWLSACLVGADPSDAENLTPGDYDFSLAHAGRVRTYLLHVPPQAADKKPLAVVLNFHGGWGTAKRQTELTRPDSAPDLS